MNKQLLPIKNWLYYPGCADRGPLCGSDHDRCADRFRSDPVPSLRSTLRAALLLNQCSSRRYHWLLSCQPALRCSITGCSVRKHCNPDRSSWFLLSWKEEQMAGMCSADPFQHHHCSMGTALCIWLYRPDPICHADCRDRRDPGYRCTWKYPVSDTGTSL